MRPRGGLSRALVADDRGTIDARHPAVGVLSSLAFVTIEHWQRGSSWPPSLGPPMPGARLGPLIFAAGFGTVAVVRRPARPPAQRVRRSDPLARER